MKQNRGFTLIETLIYLSLLIVLGAIVINSVFSLFSSYSKIRLTQDMETTAIQVLDKMTRDIHASTAVVDAQSSFNVPNGYVSLSIPNGAGTDTVKYYATSSQIKVDKNGVYLGDLSLKSVMVNSFDIDYVNGTSTKALKIELQLQAAVRNSTETLYKTFRTTVQLRDQ